MDYPPVKMVQFSGEAYAQGIVVVQADQVALRVYGVANVMRPYLEALGHGG
jgi:hypothetical protein